MTTDPRRSVAVVGVGYSDITRRVDVSLGMLGAAAIRAATVDAGISLAAIDGLATYPPQPFVGAGTIDGLHVVSVDYIVRTLQLRSVSWYAQVQNGLVVSALQEAVLALASGMCKYAVVWRAMHRPAGGYGRSSAGAFEGAAQYSAPFGCLSPVQWHAIRFRRYLAETGADRSRLGELAITFRAHAQRNPHAVMRDRPLTRLDYDAARLISEPLCLFDCDVPVNGAIAIVLTSAERAADLPHRPAFVAAVAQQVAYQRNSIHYSLNDHVDSGAHVAAILWQRAGLRPHDMSAAQLYDGFAPSVWYWLEAAGFCRRGEASDFATSGRISLDGDLPLNTAGGSLSEGRLHGMGHIAEAVLQVSGRAGPRQVRGAEAICVFDGSPMLRGGGVVLTA